MVDGQLWLYCYVVRNFMFIQIYIQIQTYIDEILIAIYFYHGQYMYVSLSCLNNTIINFQFLFSTRTLQWIKKIEYTVILHDFIMFYYVLIDFNQEFLKLEHSHFDNYIILQFYIERVMRIEWIDFSSGG